MCSTSFLFVFCCFLFLYSQNVFVCLFVCFLCLCVCLKVWGLAEMEEVPDTFYKNQLFCQWCIQKIYLLTQEGAILLLPAWYLNPILSLATCHCLVIVWFLYYSFFSHFPFLFKGKKIFKLRDDVILQPLG